MKFKYLFFLILICLPVSGYSRGYNSFQVGIMYRMEFGGIENRHADSRVKFYAMSNIYNENNPNDIYAKTTFSLVLDDLGNAGMFFYGVPVYLNSDNKKGSGDISYETQNDTEEDDTIFTIVAVGATIAYLKTKHVKFFCTYEEEQSPDTICIFK